jgi:hypothetical protein
MIRKLIKQKMNKKFTFGLAFFIITLTAYAQTPVSLVPDKPSNAPDYFCTWNVQGYICSFMTNEAHRMAMNEKNMFGDGAYQNWVEFYPKIRKDLFFVMDDSWDIPLTETSKSGTSFGLVELNQDRFPSYTGNPTERLKKLVDAVKAKEWKGLGGWICAQEAPISGTVDPATYWTEHLKSANEAGFAYWKVDWGKQSRNLEWRTMLTQLGRSYAPNLVIEHAIVEKTVSIGDVYRTYDVENIIAQPVTIERVANLLKYKKQGDAKGIINCEDEPYIAAGLGCSIGVMRYPFKGKLANNTVDYAFPPVGRDIKHRSDEVVRGVRWHRIAEPFGVGLNTYTIDTLKLKDYWVLGERETWNKAHKTGDTLRASSPARVSRGLSLAKVLSSSPNRPFVLSSLYPNGAVAIVIIGRGINHTYITERVKVEQAINSIDKPIGVFGDYESLTLSLPQSVNLSGYTVLAQDLAGETPIDITKNLVVRDNKIILSGALIRKVGLSAATKGDLSDPGLVLEFKRKPKSSGLNVNNIFNVRSYGAIGDGKNLDSPAINNAIEAAAEAGGGTVLVPAGTYLSGSIHLQNNIHLVVDAGATILGAPQKMNAYDETEGYTFGGYQDGGHSYFHNSLIWGENLTNVFITGNGIINGGGLVRDDGILNKMNGADHWEKPDTTVMLPVRLGNKAIALKLCKNVLLRDITIVHGGHFAILVTGCDNMTVDNVTMDTNRDGIDIDCCRNTIVSNCRINSPGDDGLCLKSSYALGKIVLTENVTITNCQVSGFIEGTLLDGTMKPRPNASGRIKLGTETSGGFRNITISNCTFRGCRGLALEEVDGGILENITISNISMMDTYNYAIYITTGNRNRTPGLTTPSRMKNVLISNVVVTGGSNWCGILITGLPECPLEGLRLENIRLVIDGGGTKEQADKIPDELGTNYPEPRKAWSAYGIFARHVKNLELANITIGFASEDLRPAAMFFDIKGLEIDNFKPQVANGVKVAVFGADVRGVTIRNSPALQQK